MLKRLIKVNIVFITLFYFCTVVKAYEFVNPENEEKVMDAIKSIYDEKELYDELSGIVEEDEVTLVSTNTYWWPIGSDEVVEKDGILYALGAPRTVSTSNGFGCTAENAWRTDGCHGGLDMGDGSAPGIVNVIAAKDGVVVYPTAEYQKNYEDHGFYGNTEGGGYGNYVVILHADGVYTVYGHLAKGSITVMANQEVKQGQVIGKMGHSGSSTGPHLHFTVGIGGIGKANVVDPLDYIDPDNPRPTSVEFSPISTILSKSEFVARMNDYCARSGNASFCSNFAANAEGIYNVSVKNNVNPELVVAMAGAESWWYLSDSCAYTNNYWGIEIYNGLGCNEGGIYSDIYEGVAAFARVVARYNPGGRYADEITAINEERTEAGCDPAGHGLPGTIEGMQTKYSTIGPYRYNPGNSSLGGCYYYKHIYSDSYCSSRPTCTPVNGKYNSCPAESKTTVCEYNDYTAWRVQKLVKFRRDIFGL